LSDYSTQLITESYNNGDYTCNCFCDAIPLTVNYYDSYDFIGLVPVAADKTNLPHDINKEQQGYNNAQFGSAKGLLTGTRVYH